VTKSLPAFIARTQFGQILERVSKRRERFLVTNNSAATVVILGMEGFLETVMKTPNPLAVLQQQAKRSASSKFTLKESKAEIAAFRREKKQRQAMTCTVVYDTNIVVSVALKPGSTPASPHELRPYPLLGCGVFWV
jgi:hypothetical protein